MRQSNDAGHFFQTDAALTTSSRKATKSKNQAGNPIQLLSKLTAIILDPFSDEAVYVAEAAGSVKRVDLVSGSVTHVLRASHGAGSPLTSLAFVPSAAHPSNGGSGTLFAGAWDKNVYAWPVVAKLPSGSGGGGSSATLSGHADFVKTLLAVPSKSEPLLISASADKSVMVWNAVTYEKLHVLTGHQRGVQALALDPLSLPDILLEKGEQSVVIASGDSSREIRFWRISTAAAQEISPFDAATETSSSETVVEPLIAHDTSIFELQYTNSGDLWTASADKTSKHLAREQEWKADTTLTHDDFVGCVAVAEERGLVITGCRDEDVRVWDISSGKCIARLQGHWEEVTGLTLVKGGRTAVSVSIDGTVRKWGLGPEEMKKEIEIFENGKPEEKKESLLTEDEERELAELMDDDD